VWDSLNSTSSVNVPSTERIRAQGKQAPQMIAVEDHLLGIWA